MTGIGLTRTLVERTAVSFRSGYGTDGGATLAISLRSRRGAAPLLQLSSVPTNVENLPGTDTALPRASGPLGRVCAGVETNRPLRLKLLRQPAHVAIVPLSGGSHEPLFMPQDMRRRGD